MKLPKTRNRERITFRDVETMSKNQARVKSPEFFSRSRDVSQNLAPILKILIKHAALKSHRGERDVQEIVVFHQELHRAVSTIENFDVQRCRGDWRSSMFRERIESSAADDRRV